VVAAAPSRFPRTRVIPAAESHTRLSRLGRILTTVFAVVATVALATVIGFSLYAYGHQDRIYQGVSVGGVDLSGMTRTEATDALSQGYAAYLNTPLTLTYNGENYAITSNQLGISVDTTATIDRALEYGRTGSLWSRSQDWARGLFGGTDLTAVVNPDSQVTDTALLTLTADVARSPRNATIDWSGDQPVVVPDIPGVGYDYGTTRSLLMSRIASQSFAPVAIVTTQLGADVTSDALAATLPSAEAITASALTITGAEGKSWSLDQNQMKSLISLGADGTTLAVNSDAIGKFVHGIADGVERPSSDAELFVGSDGSLQIVPSVQSLSVDEQKSISEIESAILTGDKNVALIVGQKDPQITTEMATASMASINDKLKNGIALKWGEDGNGVITSADLMAALIVTPTPGEKEPFAFALSEPVVKGYIDAITADYQVEPKEARFRLVDGVVTAVEKGQTGIVINVDDSVARIQKAVMSGYSSSTLKVTKVKAKYSAEDASAIKLPDVLGEAATPYYSSTEARKTNVERAVDLENGWLVAPGDVFSYDDTMGDVTEDNGFVVGLGILADPNNPGQVMTGPVVGGGICQVSTTIFQSAFWAGMPFQERYQHNYWINSYGTGEGGMKGLDAMVNIEPEGSTEAMTLDMKFQNTTENWIAIELTADGNYVTSRILGTDQGWDVSVGDDDPVISNIVKPDENEIRQDSPELPAGETRQVETAQDGFDTSITRTVTDKSGNVVDVYVLTSSYASTVNRVLVGTGT